MKLNLTLFKSYQYLIIAVFLPMFLTACRKYDVSPTGQTDMQVQVISGTDPASVKVIASNQVAKMSVSSNVVTINLYENVSLLLDKAAYSAAYSVWFNESTFQGSKLSLFHYDCMRKIGGSAHDYLDENLNNVVTTSADTTYNNVTYLKLNFARNVVFSNTYADATQAKAIYDSMVNTKDSFNFNTYFLSQGSVQTGYTSGSLPISYVAN
jgi:hypothetical protein